jgi:hypothetical protein
MLTTKPIILYIAYGPRHLHKQVILSILTLYDFLNKEGEFERINLIVYTDDKEIFEKNLGGININFEIITPQMIQDYIGIFNHIHRLKISVIRHCFQTYKSNILYVDGDTYFLKSPSVLISKITDDTSIFHVKEFELIEGVTSYPAKAIGLGYDPLNFLRSVIKKNNSRLGENEYQIDLNTQMWNAGVLGISVNNGRLLDDILRLTDQISKKSSYFLAEQFAFSHILGKKTTLIPSDEFIYHYWPPELKEGYNSCINIFLEKSDELNLNCKAESAVELTRREDAIGLTKKTTKKEFKMRLQKIRRLKKNEISFLIYHLSILLRDFCRYLFKPSPISSKK